MYILSIYPLLQVNMVVDLLLKLLFLKNYDSFIIVKIKKNLFNCRRYTHSELIK